MGPYMRLVIKADAAGLPPVPARTAVYVGFCGRGRAVMKRCDVWEKLDCAPGGRQCARDGGRRLLMEAAGGVFI